MSTTAMSTAAMASAANCRSAADSARMDSRATCTARTYDMSPTTTASANNAVSAAPAMPSIAAAPAVAATRRIAAPIPPGTTPAEVVPAIAPPSEEVLHLLHIVDDRKGCQSIGGYRHCLPDACAA